MSRRSQTPDPTGLSLDALRSRSERAGSWISENPAPILGSLGAMLAVALALGILDSNREDSVRAAAESLASVQRTYRAAMGAEPGAVEIVEPANAEAALAAREAAVAT